MSSATPQPAPPPPAFTPPPAPPARSSNGLATAGFVLGLLGLLGSFIPLINVVGIVLGVLGAILAAVGLAKAKRTGAGKGLAMAGLVLGVLAVVVAIVINVVFANAVDDALGATTAPSVEAPASTAVDDTDETESPAADEATEEPTEEAPADVVPLPPGANPAVGVAGIESLPDGEPGQLSVIAQAAQLDSSGSLAVVVRNLTDEPLAGIEVTGTARDANGALVGSGSDQGLDPFVVGPGEIAFGYVYFGFEGVPEGTTFELSVSGTPLDDVYMGKIDLVITEHNRTENSVLVMLTNETDREASGPIGVQLMCFDEAGIPFETTGGYAEPDTAAPGASVSASIDFYRDAPCERYLVAGSGFDF